MTGQADGAAPGLLLKDRPATLGGQSFVFRMAMLASIALKERWALADDEKLNARLARQSITDIPAMVWAATRAHHPEVTYETVLQLCDEAGAGELKSCKDVITECLVAAWTVPTTAKKKDEAAPPKRSR